MTDTRRRVKLYALNAERQWDDKGTGHVTSTYVERLKGISLLVRAESDGSLLLESKIQPDTAYQKQQETLIVWSESDNFDLALSFQEKAGCDEIWEKICSVQGKDPSVEFTQDIVEESEDERCFDDMMGGSDSVPPIELPACEIGRLEEISELVSTCLPSPMRREKLAVAIENDGYIKKLLNVFNMCEDLENSEGLNHLYEIFKNIFLLNKNALFELMFAEDTIFDVVGCLEYDPNLSEPKKHREYLKSIANFHQVIKINNGELLSKIHQTYRVQYIQDVVLPTPSVFEENMLSTLSSFIFFNKVEIVSLIQEDDRFLRDLFAQLTSSKTDDKTRKESVLFLKEFCTFSQTLQPQARESFFKTLSTLGILPALEITLASENLKTKAASIDILLFIVDFSPTMVREYMLQQLNNTEDDSLLMNVIIEQMTCDSDPDMGGAVQLMGIIRTLLDPENMLASVNKSEKTDFLNYFYKHCMHVFIAPLLTHTSAENSSSMDSCVVQLLSLILELMSFCVEQHTYHIKNYILHKDLLRRILVLMKSRHTFLVLCALRFMRKIIALKDEFYNRYIIKGNLFAPVIDAFVSNNGRYNLLDSAILEMFEFIKLEDIKSLCTHVVESFGPTLDKITYVQTFKTLKLRYDQHQDRIRDRSQSQLEGVGSILRPGRFRRDPRDIDEDEEMWFNDDEYENGEPPTMTVGATAATLSQQQQQQQQTPLPAMGSIGGAAGDQEQQQSNGTHGEEEDDDEEGEEEEEEEDNNAVGSSNNNAESSTTFEAANESGGLADDEEDEDQEEEQKNKVNGSSKSTVNSGPATSRLEGAEKTDNDNKVTTKNKINVGEAKEDQDLEKNEDKNSAKGLVDYDGDSDEEEMDTSSENTTAKNTENGANADNKVLTGSSSSDNNTSLTTTTTKTTAVLSPSPDSQIPPESEEVLTREQRESSEDEPVAKRPRTD